MVPVLLAVNIVTLFWQW